MVRAPLLVPGSVAGVARRAVALLALVGAAACEEEHGVILDVTAEQPFERLRVEVKGPEDEPYFWEELNVGAGQDHTALPFRLAVKVPSSGSYAIHLIDVSLGPPSQTWARELAISGVLGVEARLRPYPAGGDADGDSWPATCPVDALPEECTLVDCNDAEPGVNPFVVDVCGNDVDEDCDGETRACEDADGDGYDEGVDCDDDDPDVHPREPGFCEGVPPYCGNGKDEDCSGSDATCGSDADCDGHAACPGAGGACDCDDADPAIHPDAVEVCEDDVDQNCDGDPNDGCDRCDEDGDGWFGVHPERGCAVDPSVADCDDRDRGIHPMSTAACDGNEGHPACAARGYCAGPVDDDCDGMYNEGCPTCGDADGDGYAPAGCAPTPATTDCDDANPRVHPGAADRCGDGIMQNCSIDLPCSDDGDLDGYNEAADCDDRSAAINPEALEACDGVDNDCDDLVDEGNPGIDPLDPLNDDACNDDNDGTCAPLVGRCVCSTTLPDGERDAANRVTCPAEIAGAGVGPRCFGAPQPVPEGCDAQDNDCDAAIDEEVTRACETICGGGTDTCANGVWTCDAPLPQPEVCDSLDNDCDGTPDDGLGLGSPCDGGDGDQCQEGVLVCNGAGTTSCNDATGTTTEACNSLDDDCDFAVDEDFALGGACDGADADFCNEGFMVCNGAMTGTMCSDATGNNAEVCNYTDDDCDGQTDEGFVLGVACDGGDSDLCNEGVTVCNTPGTGTVCSDMTPGIVESCNYADDDCDTMVDEGFTYGGACDGGDSDMCIEGMTICNAMGTGTTCSDLTSGTTEACNGLDDDCDTMFDEGAGICGAGLRCAMGACVCDAVSGCTGCCNGAATSCLPGNTTAACGSAGETCEVCGPLADNCAMGDCRCGTAAACNPTKANACTSGACTCYGAAACGGTQVCCAATMSCRPEGNCV